jgi:hypothetical protein
VLSLPASNARKEASMPDLCAGLHVSLELTKICIVDADGRPKEVENSFPELSSGTVCRCLGSIPACSCWRRRLLTAGEPEGTLEMFDRSPWVKSPHPFGHNPLIRGCIALPFWHMRLVMYVPKVTSPR